MTTKYICANCGIEFYDYPSNKKSNKIGICCSRKCKGKYRTKFAIANSPIKQESVCKECGKTKPISEFYTDKKCVANGGIQYTCKECIKKQRIKYYDNNVVEINIRVRTYHELHPGRLYHGPTANHAHEELNEAVKKGYVIKPSFCSRCRKIGRVHAHHWNGYDHPLDIVWLCPSCHHAAHGRGPKSRIKP